MTAATGYAYDFDNVERARLDRLHNTKWLERPAGALAASAAETDFLPAPAVGEALRRAIADGDLGYAAPDGGELPAAFAGFAERHWNWRPDPASIRPVPEVIVGVAEWLRALTDESDGVVVEIPSYGPYFSVLRETNRTLVPVPLRATDGGWRRDLEGLRRAFEAGARAMLLCHPHNPTGALSDAAELRAVAELAEEHGVAIIADEIWAPLVLEGSFVPFATLCAGRSMPVVVVSSASKGFTIAGLKCALTLPVTDAAAAAAHRLPELLSHRTGLLGVLASVAAFTECDDWLQAQRHYLLGNRALLADLLARDLPEIGYQPAAATYLAWLDCRRWITEPDVGAWLSEHAGVVPTDGSVYGAPGWIRLNFGTSRHLLTQLVARMAATG